MEIPFYYSFKEFKENYETDLKKWLEVYTEGDETDFLNKVNSVYSKYYDFLGEFCGTKEVEKCIRQKYVPDVFDGSGGIYDKEGNYYEYVHIRNIVMDLDFRLMDTNFSDRDEDFAEIKDKRGLLKVLFEYNLLDKEDCLISGPIYIGFKEIYDLELFWKFDKTTLGKWYLCFDEIKYTNFKLSIPKIYNFIQEKLNLKIEKETQTPPPDEVESITLPENTDKIQINGNYQLLAFLFRELIEKGYINAPTRNGKPSHKRTAEMLLKHFEFTNKTEQPSVDNLTNYIKNNTYSMQKQSLFKIPSIKKAND